MNQSAFGLGKSIPLARWFLEQTIKVKQFVNSSYEQFLVLYCSHLAGHGICEIEHGLSACTERLSTSFNEINHAISHLYHDVQCRPCMVLCSGDLGSGDCDTRIDRVLFCHFNKDEQLL